MKVFTKTHNKNIIKATYEVVDGKDVITTYTKLKTNRNNKTLILVEKHTTDDFYNIRMCYNKCDDYYRFHKDEFLKCWVNGESIYDLFCKMDNKFPPIPWDYYYTKITHDYYYQQYTYSDIFEIPIHDALTCNISPILYLQRYI